ncbi:MAG: disulfide thiol oxidoreductase, Erv1 / Alr family [Gaeavirus sp.]|uniref:Sulfhydryl oxidase n=1 Tax=Gaeavirus sp. TaxID=2487767 RepID=A0A3G4ZYH1_9VIRU|nr:MAG: disulfide thiol oxidoreductase, Erv1 / Alr family [Gaeavirus sp.]
MAAVYPIHPDAEYIKSARMLLTSYKKMLPCASCRESYITYISQPDTDIQSDEFYKSRDNFITLIYRIRNKVNKKVGLEYNITKNYFTCKLNKMCCIENNDVDSYINNLSEAPFIQESIKNLVLNYVYKNKHIINDYNPKYTKVLTAKLLEFIRNPNFDFNDKNFKLFYKRNQQCRTIINKIYDNMSCGDYGMLESFFKDKSAHVHLFYMGCSIIPLEDLIHVFKIK